MVAAHTLLHTVLHLLLRDLQDVGPCMKGSQHQALEGRHLCCWVWLLFELCIALQHNLQSE